MRTRRYGQADLFVFEHDHNFHQLFGKLAGQQFLKGSCHPSVIPERVFFRSFPEATPHSRTDFWLTQVPKNRAGVVNFIRQRNQTGVSVNRFQVLDVAGLTCPPVLLLLTGGCIGYSILTCTHNVGHAVAKPVANIRQTRLAALVLNCIMQETTMRAQPRSKRIATMQRPVNASWRSSSS